MTRVTLAVLMQFALFGCQGALGLTPTFVQGTAFLDTSFEATSVSATFPNSPTSGNSIIVGCMGDGGSKTLAPDGVTDSQGNVYTQVAFQNYVGSGQPTALYLASNITSAGPLTVTCAGIDRADALNLFALEYAGLASADALESASADGAQSGPYPRTCGSVATTVANALIVALFNNDGSDNPTGIRPGASYALPDCAGGAEGKCAAQDGSLHQLGAMISAVAESPGTYTPVLASGPSGNGSQSICVAAAFRAAAD